MSFGIHSKSRLAAPLYVLLQQKREGVDLQGHHDLYSPAGSAFYHHSQARLFGFGDRGVDRNFLVTSRSAFDRAEGGGARVGVNVGRLVTRGGGCAPPCPKLESISLPKERASTSLLDCLLNRKASGHVLRHLEFQKVDDRFAEKLGLSVEELRVTNVPDDPKERICFVSMV